MKTHTVGTGITERTVTVEPLNRDSLRKLASKTWAEMVNETHRVCLDIVGADGLTEEYEIDSEQWFAAEILRRLKWVDNAIQAGSTDKAACYAIQAGEMIATAALKFEWEPDALRGINNRRATTEAGRKGGSNAKRRTWAEDVASQARKEWPEMTKNDLWGAMVARKTYEVEIRNAEGEPIDSYSVTVTSSGLEAERLRDKDTFTLTVSTFKQRYL